MTYKQALALLNIEEESPSMELIQKNFRKLAVKYHPDTSEIPNSSAQFIMVYAAYRFLMDNYSEPIAELERDKYEYTIDEELKHRIDTIMAEFRDIEALYKEYLRTYKLETWQMIVNRLNQYTSNSAIRKNFANYFSFLAHGYVSTLIGWHNKKFDDISQKYNDWIYKFTQENYAVLKANERKYWYKSSAFYLCFIPPVLLSIIIWLFVTEYILNQYNIDFAWYSFPALLSGYTGFRIFKKYLGKKYNLEKIKLDERQFQLTPDMLSFSIKAPTKIEHLRLNGAVPVQVGANFGMGAGLLFGLGGFAVNGAISLWNKASDFIGNLIPVRNKALKEAEENFSSINNMMASGLEKQLPLIKEKILQAVKANYKANRLNLVNQILKPFNSKYIAEQSGTK
jgi:hypothetical protein